MSVECDKNFEGSMKNLRELISFNIGFFLLNFLAFMRVAVYKLLNHK
jgi:hypothetical protein